MHIDREGPQLLSVVNNLGAMNAQRQFNITGASIKKSTEKLSSGYRINRAADDAAGLTISEKMRSLIRGMNQGSDNIQDGISVMQIADGALAEVHGMLHRMTELSIKAANGTNTAADRQAIQSEINELSAEITRIGKSTTFNTMPILDDISDDGIEGKITNLVKCGGAEKGYYGDSTEIGGKWYPSATIDFSAINSKNINRLNGGGFTFTCSANCAEAFDFKLTTDGSPSTCSKLDGAVTHYYSVDISGCKNGKEIVNRIYDYVNKHQPNGKPETTDTVNGLTVSHSNNMKKSDDGYGLIIYANGQGQTGPNAEEIAKNIYPRSMLPNSGKIDCTSLTGITSEDVINTFNIQCSNITDDYETIETYRMNATVLGVDNVDVSTEETARKAIKQIDDALNIVSEHRSAYGAFQNRLEHSYANNNNKSENITAAESRIRDTDMAREMVDLTKNNILSQAGSAMLSQAMQNPQSILQLLS